MEASGKVGREKVSINPVGAGVNAPETAKEALQSADTSHFDAESQAKLEKVAETALPKAFSDILKDIEAKGFTLRAVEFELGAIDLKFVRIGVGFGFDFTLNDMTLHAPSSIFFSVHQIEGNNRTETMVFLIVHLVW